MADTSNPFDETAKSEKAPAPSEFSITDANYTVAAKAISSSSDEAELKAWLQEETMGKNRKGHIRDIQARLAELGPKNTRVEDNTPPPKPAPRKEVPLPSGYGLEIRVAGIVIKAVFAKKAKVVSLFKRTAKGLPMEIVGVDGKHHLVCSPDVLSITHGDLDGDIL